MPKPPPISLPLVEILDRIETFEASASEKNTGTGARREGGQFEKLLADMWIKFRQGAEAAGAHVNIVAGVGTRRYASLSVADRQLLIPEPRSTAVDVAGEKNRWLEVDFGVAELVRSFPGEAEAIDRYAPSSGRFAHAAYPEIYKTTTTQFDDTIVFVESGVLREKILLEYKTAKSSRGNTIDGNAHERLSFQIMQYLEVATRYTRCSLVVVANGAFVRYKNKYHTNFHIQADRLSNFSWFDMQYLCTRDEYAMFLASLYECLFVGKPRSARGAR